MKKYLKIYLILILLFPLIIKAEPFIITDPTNRPDLVTHCSLYLDKLIKQDFPIFKDIYGSYCKIDLSTFPTGTRSIYLTFFYINENGIRQESNKSNLFNLNITKYTTYKRYFGSIPIKCNSVCIKG